jgi:Mn-containing catalase
MFHHVKELQFNARVSGPDPQFAALLLEQFGGSNGELKAAMQYFVQAFAARQPYPDKYDLLMDIATEEFSHLEIVGATITMLLDGVNGDLKNAAENCDLSKLLAKKNDVKDTIAHEAFQNPHFFVLAGGGPMVTDCHGVPWSGMYVTANGDLTVDLRSNMAAESRAKIVYEYLLQFTNDPYVKESLLFLMTREVAHFKQFEAALETIQPNFPPGVLQADPRFSHTAFNMSNGASARGPWNEGQGTWEAGEEWEYIEDPIQHVLDSDGLTEHEPENPSDTPRDSLKKSKELSKLRSKEITSAVPKGENQWCSYPQTDLESPSEIS